MARCYTGPPKLPTFNLTVDVWINFNGIWVNPPAVPKSYSSLAQLTLGERTFGINALTYSAFILLPKLTDIHYARAGGGSDYIECPAGSARFYKVMGVDDVGRGFQNEYRQCTVVMTAPIPDPLP